MMSYVRHGFEEVNINEYYLMDMSFNYFTALFLISSFFFRVAQNFNTSFDYSVLITFSFSLTQTTECKSVRTFQNFISGLNIFIETLKSYKLYYDKH